MAYRFGTLGEKGQNITVIETGIELSGGGTFLLFNYALYTRKTTDV